MLNDDRPCRCSWCNQRRKIESIENEIVAMVVSDQGFYRGDRERLRKQYTDAVRVLEGLWNA